MPAQADVSQIIDSNISQLKELKRLFQKPGCIEMATRVIAQMRGEGQENGHETIPRPLPNFDTGLKAAVLKALTRIRGDFTYREIKRAMEEDGYKFQTKGPRNAVNHVIRQLEKKGKLVEVKRGIAGDASIFRHAAVT
jgi:hypothetical protein